MIYNPSMKKKSQQSARLRLVQIYLPYPKSKSLAL